MNEHLVKTKSIVAKPVRTKEKTELRRRPWYWEGNVQSVLVSWLVSKGYTIRAVADTAARVHGKDIVALDLEGRELWISVKGYPEKSFNVQARHWFSDAVLGLILDRSENSSVDLALGLPDGFATYVNLVARIEWLRKEIPLKVYWISESGQVRVE